MGNFEPSQYNIDIFNFIKSGYGNAVVSAVAGSGKTTTLIKSLEHISEDKTVLFMAFNKSIAKELKSRVPQSKNINVSTVHSFGYQAIQDQWDVSILNNKYSRMLREIIFYGNTKKKEYIQEYEFTKESMAIVNKILKIVKKIDEGENPAQFISDVSNLVGLGRFNLINIDDKKIGSQQLKEISSVHGINNSLNEHEAAWHLIHLGIFHKSVIDFTDMIYFPIVFDMPVTKYDYVYIDECQDLSACQRELMFKCIKDITGRFIAVGDPKQAIYSFAGADYASFQKLCKTKDTIQLPLSYTYRCGKNIVESVKHINPTIKAHPKNSDGEVIPSFSYMDLKDGDMVLCRNTFPIVCLCLNLLIKEKKATIIGSDIGESLSKLIRDSERKREEYTMENVINRLLEDKNKMITRLMTNTRMTKEEALEDGQVRLFDEKIQVIIVLSEGINNPHDVIAKINMLFSDEKKDGIVLSTIHKSKGLEADNVYILAPELLPSKYAVLDWQLEQEENLRYVAYTRAKHKLGFINDFDEWKRGARFTPSKNNKPTKKSNHVGSVGMKMFFNAQIINVKDITTKFGKTTLYEMMDDKGNILSKFGDITVHHLKDGVPKTGEKVSFYGIIKDHSEFRGDKITQIGKIMAY